MRREYTKFLYRISLLCTDQRLLEGFGSFRSLILCDSIRSIVGQIVAILASPNIAIVFGQS